VTVWHTEPGDRKLTGKERKLFVHAVVALCDAIRDLEDDDEKLVDVGVFERMSREDRCYALLRVTEHLLNDEPDPPLTAWNEAAILAVYRFIWVALETELRSARKVKSPPYWRRLIHDAWMDRCYEPGEIKFKKDEGHRQRPDSRKSDAWDFKIECLMNEVLWDTDCEMDDVVVDLPPDHAKAIKGEMGISADYYTAVPPLVTEEEKGRLNRFLARLRKEAAKDQVR
jgi:hypothetical protein